MKYLKRKIRNTTERKGIKGKLLRRARRQNAPRAVRRKLAKAYTALKARLKSLRTLLAERVLGRTGTGPWGGAESIVEVEVVRFAEAQGYNITSRKRRSTHLLSLKNPGSDHSEANLTAYAVDIGTYDGANLAYDIAEGLGIENYRINEYTPHYIVRSGQKFRVQILWGEGIHHGTHVHVGVKRS